MRSHKSLELASGRGFSHFKVKLVQTPAPVTLAECLVVPICKQMTQLQQDLVNVVTAGQNTSFFLIDATVGQTAADLWARYTLKLPDALQIATAIVANCDAFLTNDDQLKRVQELNVIVIKDLEA